MTISLSDINITLALICFASLAAVVTLIPFARKIALKNNFVDSPGGRKDHKTPVPPIGGLIILPIFVSANVIIGTDIHAVWPLYAALTLIMGVSAIDDYRHINPWIRFLAQFIAAGLIVLPGHIELTQLGDLFGQGRFELGWASEIFTIVAIVLFINALNMMDGLDGLVSGTSLIMISLLSLACVLAGEATLLLPIMPIIGALMGFLIYNLRTPFRKRATVFLGDAGSMGLALVIAWFAIDFAQAPDAVIKPITMAWMMAIPVYDINANFYRRIREGRHPFDPDRGHFHHNVMAAGASHAKATAIILALALVLGAIGVFGVRAGVPEWILSIGWIIGLFAHIILSSKPKFYIKVMSTFLKS